MPDKHVILQSAHGLHSSTLLIMYNGHEKSNNALSLSAYRLRN